MVKTALSNLVFLHSLVLHFNGIYNNQAETSIWMEHAELLLAGFLILITRRNIFQF